MSGLLRRIKRTRAVDAGQAPPEGRAAAPDGAPLTTELPAGEPALATAGPDAVPSTPAAASRPAVAAGDGIPAGLEPTDAPLRPPAGRRGRLRRRLRYLRRARELMLRDLGGLLYEIHRTAGGRVSGHATVVGAKVQRIAALDAEAGALETALGAPHGEALVFQPGIGGTCTVCGELHGTGARFCSNCGTAIGSASQAVPDPAPPTPPAPPRMPAPPTTAAAGGGGEDPTRVLETAPAPADDAAPADASRDVSARLGNGRETEPAQPRPSPGDPLATKETQA